jgi:RNA polymerase sigma-70 factor (ECF subfamily)
MIGLPRHTAQQDAGPMTNSPGTRTFDDILWQTQGRVRAYIAGMGISPHDVDELAQETYLQLYRNIDKMPADASPEPWVKGIAKNVCLNHLRKHAPRGRLHRHALAEILANTTTRLERSMSQEGFGPALKDCLSKLPPERREMLGLKYEKVLSSDSIAEHTKSTADAVRVALHRIRAGLRDALVQRLARLT